MFCREFAIDYDFFFVCRSTSKSSSNGSHLQTSRRRGVEDPLAEEGEDPYPVPPGASYIERKCPAWNEERVVEELASLTLDGEAASRASPEPAPHPE